MTTLNTSSPINGTLTERRFRGRLGLTLLIYFLLVASVPSAILISVILNRVEEQTRTRTIDQMESQSEVKANDIQRWLQGGQTTLTLILSNEDQQTAMVRILETDPTRGRTATNELIRFLQGQYEAQTIFSEFFIYDTTGLIRASTDEDFSLDNEWLISDQPYFEGSLDNSTSIHPPYLDTVTDTLQMVLSQPLYNDQGEIVGVFAGRLRLEVLSEIMTTRVGLGDTGETYLVAQKDNLLITPSRFDGYSIGKSYTSDGIKKALNNDDGSGIYFNYRDKEVIGVYHWLPELQMGMMAEIETEEALRTVNALQIFSLITATITVFVAIGIGLGVTLWIIRPISALRRVALGVMNGDYSQRAAISRNNEIGELADAFNTMTAQLVHRIEEIDRKNQALETATQEAQEATRLKSEFLATVSHELRTPMNAIIGFGDMLLMEAHGTLNEKQKDRLSRLQRNAKRLLALIDDILDLSRIETGRMDIVHLPYQPKQMINRLCAQMEILSEKDNLYFHSRIAADLPDVLIGDEKRIEQVIENLLSNAFKFTEKGGVVMGVSVDKDKKIWQIAVTDTGIGISPTEQQFIFESFRQIDGSTTREYGGTGLGLSITQKMVHMMEGTITVSSQLGKGSTFTVTFPLVQPPNPHEALIQMSQRKTAVN